MDELEVKFFHINKDDTIRKLEQIRAQKIFSGRVTSRFMDRDKYDLRKSSRTLRLRRNDNRGLREDDVENTLTFKKDRGGKGAKDCSELEIKVDSLDNCAALLGKIGFGLYDEDIKDRISYEKIFDPANDPVRFELDTPILPFNDLGTYLELEIKNSGGGDYLKQAAEALGLQWSLGRAISYIKYVEEEKGVKPPYRYLASDSCVQPYSGDARELRRARFELPNKVDQLPVEFNELLQEMQSSKEIVRGYNVHILDYPGLKLANSNRMLMIFEELQIDFDFLSARKKKPITYPVLIKCVHEVESPERGIFISDDISVGVYPSENKDIKINELVHGIMKGLDLQLTRSLNVFQILYKLGDTLFTLERVVNERQGLDFSTMNSSSYLQVDVPLSKDIHSELSRFSSFSLVPHSYLQITGLRRTSGNVPLIF